MKKFRRKKLAFALACASILGGKTQAMDKNKHQSRQTLAAAGGVTSKNSNNRFVDWAKNHKLVVGAGLLIPTLLTASIVLGVKYGGKKGNGSDPSKDPNAQNFNKDNPQKNEQIEVDNKKQTNDNKPNEKKDEQIKNEENNLGVIEIEKEILEEKVKNFDLIKNKIDDIQVENKNQKDKDIIIHAFEYFANIAAENKLDDLFDYIVDYNIHESVGLKDIGNEKNKKYKVHFDESKAVLLKIFGNNSEISNIVPEFEFQEGRLPILNINFNFDGKNRKIELMGDDYKKFVDIEYFYNCDGDGEAVVFKIPYDKILETAEN